MLTLRCLCLSTVSLALIASPALSRGVLFNFVPDDDGFGLYGYFTRSWNWDGPSGFSVPGPTDDLAIDASEFVSVFANDPSDTLGGTTFEVNSITTTGSGEVMIGQDTTIDAGPALAGLKTNWFTQNSAYLTLRTNLEVVNDFTLNGLLVIDGASTKTGAFNVSTGASAEIRSGGSLESDTVDLSAVGGPAFTLHGFNSSLITNTLTASASSGTLLSMVAPLDGDGNPYEPGGVSASIGNLNIVNSQGGTFAQLTNGATTDPAYNAQTTLTIGDAIVGLSEGDLLLFDAQKGSKVDINGTLTAYSDFGSNLTVFSLASDAKGYANTVDLGTAVRLGDVAGFGTSLVVGNLTTLNPAASFLKASDSGFAFVNNASVQGSSVDRVFDGDGGRIRVVDATFEGSRGLLASARNGGAIELLNVRGSGWVGAISLEASSGGKLTIGKPSVPTYQYLTTPNVFVPGNFDLNISGSGSEFNSYGANYQTYGSGNLTLNLTDGAKMSGRAPAPFGGDYFAETFLTSSNTLRLNVQNSTIDGVSLNARADNIDADLDHATVEAQLGFFGAGYVSLNRVTGTIPNFNLYGNTGQVLNGTISNSRVNSIAFGVAAFGLGESTVNITNTDMAAGWLRIGANDAFDGGGKGTLTLDGTRMGSFRTIIGAAAYPGTTATFGNRGDLTVKGNSRLSVGSYTIPTVGDPYYDGAYTWINGFGVLTLGATSSLNVFGGGSVFIGSVTDATQEVYTNNVVTVGANGILNGAGTINGAVVGTPTAAVVNAGGSIQPGFSPGHLTINGTYEQTAGDLVLEIGGSGVGDYDQLTATGGFTFSGGKIILKRYGGYTGVGDVGKSFSFLIGPSFDWTGFDFTSGIDDQTGLGWTFSSDGSGQFTQAVPEPGSMLALGLGALALIRRRRQR